MWRLCFGRKPKSVHYEVEDTVDVKEDPLYIILPYFNYCGFQRRKQLFLEFLDRYATVKHTKIVVVEAAETGVPFDLPFRSDVFAHLRFEVSDRLWIKENLINLGVDALPSDWKYMAWIDADITFFNSRWVEDTIDALKKNDVVQMFQSAVNLGPQGECFKLDQGFAYQYRCSGRAYTKTYKYGFWHPGFAWSCTRKAYGTMQGIIDWGILGSGDHHMALAMIQKVDQSHPGGIHANYQKKLRDFQSRVKGLTLGFTPGTILHHWHGRLEDRKYRERWDILVKGAYDPCKDIQKNRTGVMQLTAHGDRLRVPIHEYFVGRKEDCMKRV